MSRPSFQSARKLAEKAVAYFTYIEGEYHLENLSGKEQKVWRREPEPATISGLALHLGFNSKQAFEDYEQNGKFGRIVKKYRLQIECLYEKRLHLRSASGAIFALKNLGWKDTIRNKTTGAHIVKDFKIEIIERGPKLAASEKEVVL